MSTKTPSDGTLPWALSKDAGVRNSLIDVSCATASLCAAVRFDGLSASVLVSENPGAAAPTWSASPLDTSISAPTGISCPTTTFCAVISGDGHVSTTSNAGDTLATWSGATAAPTSISDYLRGISCASTTLCVAVGNGGIIATSTNPDAATPIWTTTSAGAGRILTAVSCPTATFCAAADASGDVLISQNPAAATPTWASTIVTLGSLKSIACTSISHCTAAGTDGAGVSRAYTSLDPEGGPSTWNAAAIGDRQVQDVACASATRCIAVDNVGRATAGRAPDTTPPTFDVVVLTEGQHLALGAQVSASVTCADDSDGMGVATCLYPATLDSGSAGAKTFTATAADNAGNTATKTIAYTVDPPADVTAPTITIRPRRKGSISSKASRPRQRSHAPMSEAAA